MPARSRRAVLSAVAAAATGGCLDVFRPDSDDDGVPDGEDAAPRDPRVDRYLRGDPAPAADLEVVAGSRTGGTVTLEITYTGGDPFTADNADRLELAAAGEPLGTVPLPFQAGDTHRVEGVPVGQRVVLVWFGHESEAAVLGATTVERATAR